MLNIRKIELCTGAPGLPQTLISQEMLADCRRASQLLSRAKVQAKELLRQATEHREKALEKLTLEFWRRANAQLKEWEKQQHVMCDNLEQYATSIANQTILCLLEEAPVGQRLSALVKQLLATQVPSGKATLLCHPLECAEVERCLSRQHATFWTLRPDDRVRPQSLVLETEEGDFCINWASLCETVLVRDVQTPGA
ncbi:MAG: type III secretion system stator protein SctL [Pseudomonas sp.]|uniref:type III secretion system stator protein SctL n=1 Tax=Pseudomonas TaxID=286 RepID=UPI00147367FD|nr:MULTISPECIES: type III secretion system stator protein SctL [Pseudomonas]MBL7230091.1 type III secretion system stator protein SctL [Pseudomonas sp.]MCU0212856.1 type III secretion system stator protein SctL [Pseudomonas shahriarae]NMY22734.1 type III secretion system stator protein SctL [Pseudomonas sp. WS 5410]